MTQPAEPRSYADAVAQAAAVYAAAKAAPDPLATIAHSARAAAEAVGRAQVATAARIAMLWRGVNPYSDGEVEQFASQAGAVLVPAQKAVARATAAARTQQLQAAGVRVVVTPRVPDDVRSAAPDGTLTARRGRARVTYDNVVRTIPRAASDTGRVMVRVAETYRYSRSQGNDHQAATEAAQNRIETLVDGNLQITRALVEHQSLVQAAAVDLDREIVGYRRIIHPEMSKGGVCGMCVVAADRVYKIGTLKAIHARCWCTVVEVYSDYDPGLQLNGADLERLYDAAGGNTREALKRTRYRVVEHSELGPQLVPAKGVSVPYLQVPAALAVPA